MATVEDAVARGALLAFDIPTWDRRMPIRPLWLRPELVKWADTAPELHDPALALGHRTLFEHLLQMFCDFRCAPRLAAGDLRRMMPNRKGVWKMHPPRLRIYGWAPGINKFVAVTWALESETKKDKKLNDKKRDEVIDFINKQKLAHTIVRGDILAVFPNKN